MQRRATGAIARSWRIWISCALTVSTMGVILWAQGPPMRRHRAVATRPLQLEPAREDPPAKSRHAFNIDQGKRHISANGIPEHKVGQFPNRGNPHAIRAQRYDFRVPAEPEPAKQITSINSAGRRGPPNLPFGIALNGVLLDPGTAEFYNGDRRLGWNYEALGGAVPLGIDENHAHVQPNGGYHYHGLPSMLLQQLGHAAEKHSPQIGWAADGFPIYALYGFKDPEDLESEIVELRSSFRLKKGNRPRGRRGPGGKYDGTFVQDYEYVADTGDLDECNGRFCKTPEFPDGTYAYFLTTDWPVIPRAFRGTPANFRGPPANRRRPPPNRRGPRRRR